MQTRARQFGGSSSLWAGYCALFDPDDFVKRDWVAHSGWPFGVEEILPYYPKTAELLNLRAPLFDAAGIAKSAGLPLPSDGRSLRTSVWRFGVPTRRFGDDLRDEFESSSSITVLLHVDVVDIRLDSSHEAVIELALRTLDGRTGRVRADLFVLAMGGIATPRLLLHSDKQLHHGVANGRGLVGRFFMEHPHRSIAPLSVQADGPLASWARRKAHEDGRDFLLCLGLPPSVQAQAGVLNARAHVYRTPDMDDGETPRIGMFMEQAPNPESRVTLSDRIDALGMRVVRLDWQLDQLDRRTYTRTAALLAMELERVGAARLDDVIDAGAFDREPLLHSNHHLGTTRMSACTEDGVVDADCRVHDLENLYIVGGSVFPTVSWANPTFTVLALTLRLAQHLRAILHQPRDGPTSNAQPQLR